MPTPSGTPTITPTIAPRPPSASRKSPWPISLRSPWLGKNGPLTQYGPVRETSAAVRGSGRCHRIVPGAWHARVPVRTRPGVLRPVLACGFVRTGRCVPDGYTRQGHRIAFRSVDHLGSVAGGRASIQCISGHADPRGAEPANKLAKLDNG